MQRGKVCRLCWGRASACKVLGHRPIHDRPEWIHMRKRQRRRENGAQWWWKAFWRQMRIHRREHLKAMDDILCYGSGMVLVDKQTGEPRHIPIQEIRA